MVCVWGGGVVGGGAWGVWGGRERNGRGCGGDMRFRVYGHLLSGIWGLRAPAEWDPGPILPADGRPSLCVSCMCTVRCGVVCGVVWCFCP